MWHKDAFLHIIPHTYDTVSLRWTVMIRGRIGASARQEGRWQQVEEGAKNGGHFLRLAGSGTTRLLVVVVCCRLHHCGLRPPAVHTAAALDLPALDKRQPRGSHLMMMMMMRPIVFLPSIRCLDEPSRTLELIWFPVQCIAPLI